MNAGPPPLPRNRPVHEATADAATAERAKPANEATRFVAQALAFEGQPYAWGGGHDKSNVVQPVDCSGLIVQAAQMTPVKGVIFGGKASEMQGRGEAVPFEEAALKPGDLLFKGEPASHVGIYLGNGQVLHASETAGMTVVESLADATARGAFDSARRLFDEPAQAVPPRPTWRAEAAAPADGLALGGNGRPATIGLPPARG